MCAFLLIKHKAVNSIPRNAFYMLIFVLNINCIVTTENPMKLKCMTYFIYFFQLKESLFSHEGHIYLHWLCTICMKNIISLFLEKIFEWRTRGLAVCVLKISSIWWHGIQMFLQGHLLRFVKSFLVFYNLLVLIT